MVNLTRKRPLLALAVGNPSAETWLRGEIAEYMDVLPQTITQPEDLMNMDADLVLIARQAQGSDVGMEDFAGILESAVQAGTDSIVIVGNLNEAGEAAARQARELHVWAVLTSAKDSEGVGGEEVLERLMAYLDDWRHRKEALKPGKTRDDGDQSAKRRVPLFGSSRPPVPKGRIVGVTSAGGSGGTMLAWNLATALASQGESVSLINASDPTLSVWTHVRETRLSVLKGAGEEALHYLVKMGLSAHPMSEEEWVLAARLSQSQRVIVDLTQMTDPPLEHVETLIHVRDVDPAHTWTPSQKHLTVMNRVPADLPISSEDILMAMPAVTLGDYHNQVVATWTGRPLVLDVEGMQGQLAGLLNKFKEGQTRAQTELRSD